MNKQKMCFAGLCLCILSLLCSCGAASGSSSTQAPSGSPVVVNVTLGDFFISSPTTTFTSGVHYRFVVINKGGHHHDFLIMHPGQTELSTMDQVYQGALTYIYNIAPGQTKTLDYTFTNTAPTGMLEFSCHYGGHYEAGMHAPIVVNAPAGAQVSPYPNNGIPQGTGASTDPSSGPCDTAVKVTIGANDVATPASASLKAGDTLIIVNTTNNTYTLTTNPDAGVRYTVVDVQETEYVPFVTAGTFTVSSQEHSDLSIKVTVSSTKGYTCGTQSVATVSFDANYTNPEKSQYFFTPATVTIKEGQSITLSNLSDYDLTFSSAPDADLGDIAIDKNEHQLLFFADDGTYVITCKQFAQEHVTIVVQDSDDN